ncbi:MAG: Rho termination factor N-terminal domain-containing protein [Deltaproteobacteria bacterium]|nr:MAG: Rho termination factor N-terminal domain-containing protein [Deltaproteobacteria bacterium]
MTVNELRVMAKPLGIKPVGLRKAELIKSIQRAERNFDCSGTAIDYRDQLHCLFRDDCIGIQSWIASLKRGVRHGKDFLGR